MRSDAIRAKSIPQVPPLHLVAPVLESSETKAAKPYGWILNPAIDLVFCCGGLLWLMFLASVVFKAKVPGISDPIVLLAIAGTHLLGETHTAATLERLHQSADTRKVLSGFGKILTAVCLLLAGAALFVPALPPILAKIYLIWIVQHFLAQTYGIGLIYCYKRGYIMNLWEKRIYKLVIDATIAYAIIRQLTFKEWSAGNFIGQQLPFWGPLPEPFFLVADAVLKFAVVAFVAMIVVKFVRERKVLPLPAALLMVTGVGMFLLPKSLTNSVWIYVPAFYHGSQYLVVSISYFLKERGLPEGVSTSQIGGMLLKSTTWKYYGTLFVVGIFIYGGVPALIQEFGIDYKVAFATVFCIINFHHFLIDAAIWRLRDPRVKKLLIA